MDFSSIEKMSDIDVLRQYEDMFSNREDMFLACYVCCACGRCNSSSSECCTNALNGGGTCYNTFVYVCGSGSTGYCRGYS